MTPLVSVLLVSYNSRRFLSECIESLVRQISVPFEIVMVDNASTDGSAEAVRQEFPDVRVIENAANTGFTGGNNLAARHARGRFLLLINCDTILLTDIVAGIRILEELPGVAVVGAPMYNGARELQANTGHFPAPWRLWKFTLQWSTPQAEPMGPAELSAFRTDWVEGSFLLTTRENWEAVDGMDEAGFMYTEDVEFCGHTRQRGLLTVHCTKLGYVHFGGYSDERMEYLYAGYRRFHASCSTPGARRRAEAVLLAGLVPRISVYWLVAVVTRSARWRRKYEKFVEVARRWRELAPRPSTRRPRG